MTHLIISIAMACLYAIAFFTGSEQVEQKIINMKVIDIKDKNYQCFPVKVSMEIDHE